MEAIVTGSTRRARRSSIVPSRATSCRRGRREPPVPRHRARPRRARRCRRRAARAAGRRRRHLRREPQHQLHQRLHQALHLLRVQPRPPRGRRLLPADRRGRAARARSVGPRRHRGVHPGRAAAQARRLLLRRPRARAQDGAARAAPARLLAGRGAVRRDPRASCPIREYLQRAQGGRARHAARHVGRDPRRGGPRRHRARPHHHRRSGSRSSPPRTRSGIRTTSTIMYGHVETYRHWMRHMALLRDIQKRHRRLHRVRAALVHPPRGADVLEAARPRRARTAPPATRSSRCTRSRASCSGRRSATSRPRGSRKGRSMAQSCSSRGANDLGGTLINESISTSAGASYGQLVPPRELRRLIRDAGRVPVQRTSAYGTVQRFPTQEDDRDEPARRDRRSPKLASAPTVGSRWPTSFAFHDHMKVVALAGGTGAAKFLRGLSRVIDPADLTIVGNTGRRPRALGPLCLARSRHRELHAGRDRR